jgi:hypothetical protein
MNCKRALLAESGAEAILIVKGSTDRSLASRAPETFDAEKRP